MVKETNKLDQTSHRFYTPEGTKCPVCGKAPSAVTKTNDPLKPGPDTWEMACPDGHRWTGDEAVRGP